MDKEHGVIIEFPGNYEDPESYTSPSLPKDDEEEEILDLEPDDDIDFYEDDLYNEEDMTDEVIIDEDESNQEQEEKEPFRLSAIQLPSGLQESYIKTILLAGAVAIASLGILIVFKAIQSLFGFILAGWGIYKAIALKIDYSEGNIREVSTVCASVSFIPGTSYTKLVFREDGEDDDTPPRYYEFKVPGSKKNRNFLQNYVYVLYFRESDPKNLLGYVQL